MKKVQEPKTEKVKMLRGAVGDGGKHLDKGKTYTVRQNLAKILCAAGRAELSSEKE